MSNDLNRPGDDGHPLGLPYYGCPMGDAVIRFLKNYARFSGRASRSEFWWVMLALVIADAIFNTLSTGTPGGLAKIFAVLFVVFQLLIIVPSLALMTRRAHDTNLSGWWVVGLCVLYAISGSLVTTAFLQSFQLFSPVEYSTGAMAMTWGGGVLSIVAAALFFVITLRKPRPEGVRFDKQVTTSDPRSKSDGRGFEPSGVREDESSSNIIG